MNNFQCKPIYDFNIDGTVSDEIVGYQLDHESFGPNGIICESMQEVKCIKNQILRGQYES